MAEQTLDDLRAIKALLDAAEKAYKDANMRGKWKAAKEASWIELTVEYRNACVQYVNEQLAGSVLNG